MEQQKPARHFKPMLGLASASLFFSLAVAAGAGYYYWQTKTALQQTHRQLQTALKQTETHLSELRNATAYLQARLQQQQADFAELQQLKTGNPRPWALAETHYLVQLADYNLVFNRDVAAAILLLQTADQRLAAVNGAGLIPIRQAIAKYINALQAASPLDLAGLLIRLNILQEQVSQLPLRTALPAPEKSASPATNKSEDLSSWQRALRISWETLQKLIVIRHHEQPVAPLLPQEQQAYLQQNLQLFLQQAQWAALRGQTAIYQNSLQQAKNALQRYFVLNAKPTQTAMQMLTDLQKINIRPTLPTLSALAQAIQKTSSATTSPLPPQGE